MRPLEGLLILDLSRVLAAPLGLMMLAEMGARVIKVEQPGQGDELRANHPFVKGESGYFFAANRSKQSITLNLKAPEAQEIVRRLAAQADALVENFVVGTLARMSLDYDSLKRINPSLVYVSLTGFGQDGPYAKRRGYDTILQAMTGMMSLTGEPGRAPIKAGLPTVDLSCALWTMVATLTGLVSRNATGHGCYVDVSMMDTQVAMLGVAAQRYFALGEVPARMGSEHLGRVPSGALPCGDGKWIQITTGDNQWPDLCKVLGITEWGAREEVATNDARLAHRSEVMDRLREEASKYSRDDLVAKCSAAGVPIGPINDLDDVINDAHVRARGVVQEFNHPTVGKFPGLAMPLKFRDVDQPQFGRPPLLGEHTDEVLREYLGYDAPRIAALREAGAI